MASFVSSVINKSGRTIAPKRPPRRRGPPILASSATATPELVQSQSLQPSTLRSTDTQEQTSPSAEPAVAGNGAASDTRASKRRRVDDWRSPSPSAQLIFSDEEGETASPANARPVRIENPVSLAVTGRPDATPIELPDQIGAVIITPPQDIPRRRHAQTPLELAGTPRETARESADRFVITTPAEIDTGTKAAASKRKKRAPRAVTGKPQTAETVETNDATPSQNRTRSTRMANLEKRKGKKAQKDTAPPKDPSEGDPESPADDADSATSEASKPKRRTRKRVATPEGANEITIVPSMVTMYELAARERRTGLKSEREKKMQSVNWAEVKKRQREKELELAMRRGPRRMAAEGLEAEPGATDDEDAGDIDAQLARAAASNRGRGIRIRIVNGEHVVDEQSQTVDRRALAGADVGALEEVDEDDLTRRFTARTHQNLKRREPAERVPATDRWSEEDTTKFYECISRFGTDFLVVSKMFKGRSRRHIKAKFAREERQYPERVAAALVCERTDDMRWDLEVFRQAAGMEHEDFRDPEQVMEELRERKAERELLIEEARKETADLQRQKALAGELAAVSDEEEEVVDEDVVETIEQDV